LTFNVYSQDKVNKKMTVAVVEFDVKGDIGIKDAGAIIAEWMVGSIHKTKEFDLKERVLLRKVLKEQNLGMTGAISAETAAKIGKLFGVKGIITGSVLKWGQTVSVTSRLIDTDNGTILKVATVKTTDIERIPNEIDSLALIIAGKQIEEKIQVKLHKDVKGKEPVKPQKDIEEKTSIMIQNKVFVKGGCFQMGCGSWTGNCDNNEKPVHEVCVDDFYIDKYEVTQREYEKVMGENPSHFRGDNNPVDRITWHNANEYCSKTGKQLPTEAEWEYAARSGGKEEMYAGSDNVDSIAWYAYNAGRKTHPVGQKSPNGLGIYDMSGNVWEWVADWYHGNYYKHSPQHNPKGPGEDWKGIRERVLRGGSWYNPANYARSSVRIRRKPHGRDAQYGFRCAGTL
jgi:formylglycine-generating enzyme required for sulfatase activity